MNWFRCKGIFSPSDTLSKSGNVDSRYYEIVVQFLHDYASSLEFLIRIIGDPFCNSKLCGGSSDSLTESKNSVGKLVALTPLLTEL